MRHQCSKPLGIRNHIRVQSSNILCGPTWQTFNVSETVVKITCFKVVVFAFRSGGVIKIFPSLGKFTNGLLKLRRASVVQYNHSKAIGRVIRGAGRCSSVSHGLEIFARAGQENVDSWAIFLVLKP